MSDIEAAKTLIRSAQVRLDAALLELEDDPMPPLYAGACQDREPRPKPALPELGLAGYWFTDPSFGTALLRVTDTALGGSSWRVPSNAHLAAWNADSTRFVLVGQTGTQLFAFDGQTVRPLGSIVSQCEPCWSRTDPHVIYVVGGPAYRTIQSVTLSGDAIGAPVDLLDLDTLGLGLAEPRTYVGGLITGDWDLVVFFGGTGQDQHCYVGQLAIGASELSLLIDTREQGYLLHSVAAARARQYIALYPTNAQPYQTVIVDTVSKTFTPVTVSPGGHDALSYGWWVNADSGTAEWDAAQWQLRMLAALDNRRDLIDPVLRPKEIYLSEHSTWNNARPDAMLPVISSTFRFNNESADWRAWDDEVIAIATDGPSTVYRFCHHRSDSRDESNSAGTYFWYQPIANVSPCGRWCLFTSNWEKTLGPDPADAGRSRQDVFLVQLEAV